VRVPFVAVPLTYYNIETDNRTLHILNDVGGPLTIELPLGNHSIDEVLDAINRRLINGFSANYIENVNLIHITTSDIARSIEIGHDTTCGELLGIRVGNASAMGTLIGHDGVNLAGGTSFFIKSNLRTRNRDPRSLGYSNILCNVPITKAHNGLERFSQNTDNFVIKDRVINYITIEILDDSLNIAKFHGGTWQVTLEFHVSPVETYNAPIRFRDPPPAPHSHVLGPMNSTVL
jgi:hypothetical protein